MKFLILALSLTCLIVACAGEERVEVKAVYKQDLELDCGSDEVHREVVNGTDTKTEKVAEKENKVKYNTETKKLTLVDVRGEELKTQYVCVNSNGQVVKRFQFNIAPKLFKPEKASQTVTEGGFVELKCSLLFGAETTDWKWRKNETDLNSDDQYKITSTGNITTLAIMKVNEQDKGNFTCVVINAFGQDEEHIQLRVKDALAALWPFLAIVAEVVILCIIILIYEKKCAKKPANNEEENEQAQNLMGKDSGVQKRNVK